MDLGSLRIWNLDLHLFLFEDHSVPKHFYSQFFVEIRICPFRIFSSYVFWNVRRAVAFGQQVILFHSVLIISTVHISNGVGPFELLGRGVTTLVGIAITSHFVDPLVYVEKVAHLMSCFASSDAVRSEDILQVGAHRDFVLFVVLVHHHLVSSHRRK